MSATTTASPARSRRAALRPWAPVGLLAAVCYVPLLLTHRGMVGADTKSYLYLDPGRLLGRAWSMWDPNVGLGTVPHQNIGYLWPMGPFYWAAETLGLPDWLAQRLWLGSILFLAGLGVRYLLRTLGQSGPGVTAAMFLYALSPYVLTLGARISALLLPFTALGWMLGLTIRATRERSWVHPALFALAVPTFGSTNATALVLVGIAPALWIPYATFVLREIRLRAALAVTARIGVLTIGASLWWIVGLWAQGSFGIDVLRYTETAKTVADASSAPELLRGLGYWYFYGDDKLGAWIEPSVAYTQNPGLIALTYAVPVVGLLSAAVVRWRYRSFFAALAVVGLVVSVGAHPWDDPSPLGEGFKAFLQSQAGLAMRSLPRAVPLVSLALAVLTGAAVTALGERLRRFERPAAGAIVVLAILALPPLWRGQMVADNLQRDEQVPEYWTEAAAEIDARGQLPDGGYGSRVLEVPGSDFASYRWGDTVDPITPGLTDRPYVARELIPYGTPPSADLLNALDRQMQEDLLDPDAITPVARLMGVGDVVLRGDLAYERYNLVRPRQVYELLRAAPGLGPVTGFGGDEPNVPDPRLPLQDEIELGADPDLPDPPKVGLFTVEGDPSIVVAKPTSDTVLLSGSADGIIAAAAAGLIDGDELIRYTASFAADGGGGDDALVEAASGDAPLVITDTNRKAGQRWGVVHETEGQTEGAGEDPLEPDPSDNRLPIFPGAGTDTQTVAVDRGGVTVRASSYGNSISYTPEDRAPQALDDDLRTSWTVGAFSPVAGERLEITYDEPRTTDSVRLLQARNGVQNRWITRVRLRFDDGDPVEVDLTEASRDGEGQWLEFPERTFSTLDVEITATDAGRRDSYDGLSAVGFADVRLGDGDLRLEESIRPPTDALDALGPAATDHPLALVLTRRRARPTAALRSDEESTMVRDLDLPEARDFGVEGTGRIAPTVSDALLHELLGRPGAGAGGVTSSSSRRLPGDLTAGASAAVDGDPTTHWSPGFLGQDGEWTSYDLAAPTTFDHLDLRVVADGRHSVPTRLRIEADGGEAVVVDVPAVEDRPERDATVEVPIDLPEPVTGSSLRITVEDTREALTNDWISREPVVMPVGITEWGIDGLSVPAAPATVDTGCRDDLVAVDGEPVPARLTGSTEQALAGGPLDLQGCAPTTVPAGPSQLRTGDGRDLGVQVDSLTLRSDAGGAAHEDGGLLLPDATTVPTRVTSQERWRSTVEVGPREEDTWLVIGQSDNDGWTASIDGEDLGPPVLVDGYSSAFLVPAGSEPVTVDVAWAPQRVVLAGLGASVLAVLACLVLALRPWRWRRRREADPAAGPPDERPLPLALGPVLRSAGTSPSWPTTAATAVGAAAVGLLAVNLPAGVLLGLAALVGLRARRARPLLAFGPALLLVAAAAYIDLQQVRYGLPPGFQWPQRFGLAHGLAYTGVLLLGLDLVVGRLRTGRWWPRRDDEEPVAPAPSPRG